MREKKDSLYLSNNPKSKDKLRLFCFPYAGGGSSVFRKWTNMFPSDVGVYPIQYPGRENRIGEKPIKKMEDLIEKIYDSIKDYLKDVPFVFFGHSLGTKIIYELTLKIERELNIKPKALIVSAGRAPFYLESKPIYHLKDDEFVKELKRFSGTPKEILSNKDLMKIFIPMLRADFQIDETYIKKNLEKLDVPILGFMGTKDEEMTLKELKDWEKVTKKTFKYEMIEGGHLFINTNKESVISSITKYLRV
ncbi:thioesterase II family protein [Clostridium oceanicum]|uniref:Thioesterase domain-containing protein n=1 Tax=Clostridium oceanicum TaxID=1543 RepID=A0ABN1JDI0_9CLOT